MTSPGRVATTVGREILSGDLNVFFDETGAEVDAHSGLAWVATERIPASGEETAYAAIQNGKDVVLINIEADVTIGRILKKKAAAAGVPAA